MASNTLCAVYFYGKEENGKRKGKAARIEYLTHCIIKENDEEIKQSTSREKNDESKNEKDKAAGIVNVTNNIMKRKTRYTYINPQKGKL